MEKAKVTLPSDSEVKLTRDFVAPAALVYRAYTEAALMKRWLGSPGWTMLCEMEVRVGGEYSWRWRNDEDGKEFGFHGEFLELAAPAKIAHTQHYDPGDMGGDMGHGSVITVTFNEKNGVTTVTTLMDYKTKQARDAAMSTGMTDGMEVSFGKLDALLAGGV